MDVKEKLVELLNEVQETGVNEIPAGFGCTQQYISNERVAAHLISHSVTVQEWIPVTERLPGNEGTYLVYTERGSVYASHFYTEKRFASGYVREAQWSQRGTVKVTHWMPLPSPPKGE